MLGSLSSSTALMHWNNLASVKLGSLESSLSSLNTYTKASAGSIIEPAASCQSDVVVGVFPSI